MTFDLFMNIDYHQTLPKGKFHATTEEYRVSDIQRDYELLYLWTGL